MAWIAVAGTGISLAGKIYGSVKGGQANKATQKMIDQEQAENKADYSNSANKDYLETNEVKGVTKVLKENLDLAQKSNASRGVINGASDESVVAANTGAAQTYADAISRIASKGTDYQNQQKVLYRGQKNVLNSMQSKINSDKAQNAANLVGNAGELVSTVAGMTSMPGIKDPASPTLAPRGGGPVASTLPKAPVAGLGKSSFTTKVLDNYAKQGNNE